jgi:hypothetical protein
MVSSQQNGQEMEDGGNHEKVLHSLQICRQQQTVTIISGREKVSRIQQRQGFVPER